MAVAPEPRAPMYPADPIHNSWSTNVSPSHSIRSHARSFIHRSLRTQVSLPPNAEELPQAFPDVGWRFFFVKKALGTELSASPGHSIASMPVSVPDRLGPASHREPIISLPGAVDIPSMDHKHDQMDSPVEDLKDPPSPMAPLDSPVKEKMNLSHSLSEAKIDVNGAASDFKPPPSAHLDEEAQMAIAAADAADAAEALAIVEAAEMAERRAAFEAALGMATGPVHQLAPPESLAVELKRQMPARAPLQMDVTADTNRDRQRARGLADVPSPTTSDTVPPVDRSGMNSSGFMPLLVLRHDETGNMIELCVDDHSALKCGLHNRHVQRIVHVVVEFKDSDFSRGWYDEADEWIAHREVTEIDFHCRNRYQPKRIGFMYGRAEWTEELEAEEPQTPRTAAASNEREKKLQREYQQVLEDVLGHRYALKSHTGGWVEICKKKVFQLFIHASGTIYIVGVPKEHTRVLCLSDGMCFEETKEKVFQDLLPLDARPQPTSCCVLL